jgi:hypothetical protein
VALLSISESEGFPQALLSTANEKNISLAHHLHNENLARQARYRATAKASETLLIGASERAKRKWVAAQPKLERAAQWAEDNLRWQVYALLEQFRPYPDFIGPVRPPPIPNRLRIYDIQKIVAIFFRISRLELISARRDAQTAQARQIAIFLCRQYTMRSLPEIGRRFHRDHTTVIHALRKIGAMSGESEKLEDRWRHRWAFDADTKINITVLRRLIKPTPVIEG